MEAFLDRVGLCLDGYGIDWAMSPGFDYNDIIFTSRGIALAEDVLEAQIETRAFAATRRFAFVGLDAEGFVDPAETGISLGFRIHKTNGDLVYTTSYVTPTQDQWGDWNTLNYLAHQTSSVTPQETFSVKIRLKRTLDTEPSPEVWAVNLLQQLSLPSWETFVLEKLISGLKAKSFLGRYHKAGEGRADVDCGSLSDSLSPGYKTPTWLSAIRLSTGKNVFSSYNPSDRKIQYSEVIPDTETVELGFSYGVDVMAARHPGFVEVESLPCLVISNLIRNPGETRGPNFLVLDRLSANHTAYRITVDLPKEMGFDLVCLGNLFWDTVTILATLSKGPFSIPLPEADTYMVFHPHGEISEVQTLSDSNKGLTLRSKIVYPPSVQYTEEHYISTVDWP